ncbi:MAG TPA: hypothetical protein VHW23_18700 [Kofleriaceae bacterium]|nr:hypothetical protein [Kofleriaceae bacterium]
MIALWRRRYANAIRRLREAGIATVADERAEADRYIALRERWVREVATLALAMGFELEEVDPAGWKPDMHGRARQQMLDRSIPSTPIGGAPHRPF